MLIQRESTVLFFYKILLTLIPTEILLFLVKHIVSCPQWLFSRQSRDGPHGVCGDALCLLLLTPVCLTSVYLCGMGSLAYLQRGAWEGVGLAFLSLIVLFTFFVWGFTTVRWVSSAACNTPLRICLVISRQHSTLSVFTLSLTLHGLYCLDSWLFKVYI